MGQMWCTSVHSNRYEVDPAYVTDLERKGLHLAGVSVEAGYPEAFEMEGHPFYIAVVYHPEYISRPGKPHPLFVQLGEARTGTRARLTDARQHMTGGGPARMGPPCAVTEQRRRDGMPLEMPQADTPRLKAMLDVAEENLRALEWFSGYLNLCPRFVRGEDVEMLVRECGVTGEEAVPAADGLCLRAGHRGRPVARRMAERYFRPGVRCLDAAACRADPYYASVRLPEVRQGDWTLGYKAIEAYEAFASGDLLLLPDGREVPQAGYFLGIVLCARRHPKWPGMDDRYAQRLSTMTADIRAVSGKVAVFGLGLGYYAFMAARKAGSDPRDGDRARSRRDLAVPGACSACF